MALGRASHVECRSFGGRWSFQGGAADDSRPVAMHCSSRKLQVLGRSSLKRLS